MPYSTAKRFHDSLGRRISRFFIYMKAKRMYDVITRDIAFFEARFLKSKMHGV